jgi:hypothetical protein
VPLHGRAGPSQKSDALALVARELWLERSRTHRWTLGPACLLRWTYIAPGAANLAVRGLDRRIYVPVHLASIFGMAAFAGQAAWFLVVYTALSNLLDFYPGSWGDFAFMRGVCVAIAVLPVMLFLANIGRRLMKLRIAGMVAEMNLARTPESIQAALRRALNDPSLIICLTERPDEYEKLTAQLIKGRRAPATCYRINDGRAHCLIDCQLL